MKFLYWLLLGWFMPVVAFIALWCKLVLGVCGLLLKVFVWGCQQAIKLIGKVAKAGEERVRKYQQNRKTVATV